MADANEEYLTDFDRTVNQAEVRLVQYRSSQTREDAVLLSIKLGYHVSHMQ